MTNIGDKEIEYCEECDKKLAEYTCTGLGFGSLFIPFWKRESLIDGWSCPQHPFDSTYRVKILKGENNENNNQVPTQL